MSSDWKESGIKRRDSRRDTEQLEEKHLPKKKDTKKWCKGKKGVEHDPEWVNNRWCEEYTCKNCGKVLDYKYPERFTQLDSYYERIRRKKEEGKHVDYHCPNCNSSNLVEGNNMFKCLDCGV